MKRHRLNFSVLYEESLRAHLEQGQKTGLETAAGLGVQALAAGLTTLDFTKLHEKTLVMQLLPSHPAARRSALIKKAGSFFTAAIAHGSNGTALEPARLKKIIEILSNRTVELAVANQKLMLEIARRKDVEASLIRSEKRQIKSLDQSDLLKEQLRELSRGMLSAQEDEEKKISRELHDVIAQALMSINVRLAALKSAKEINSKGFENDITLTQKMVTKSANIVHQFARELRPTALDDLGLIPTLHSLLKAFTTRTGVLTYLTVFAGVEKLNSTRRTVLYRIAQEALANVARHAHASRVDVTICKESKSVRMEVSDDGKSFDVQRVLHVRGNKRLGLLSIRERVEMVGGLFQIESVPGAGTKIIAHIPITRATGRKWEQEMLENKNETP